MKDAIKDDSLLVIKDKEKKVIKKIMLNYNCEVVSIKKSRSAYEIETTTGKFCLKKMKHGFDKVKNGFNLVEELNKIGFDNTAKYIKTNEEEHFVKSKKRIFYLTEWIDGEECNLSKLDEAEECVKLLAKFHVATKQIDLSKLKIKDNLKNWPKVFNKNLNDLGYFKRVIERKKIKNEFDIKYYEHIDNFLNIGITALKILDSSEYNNISNVTPEEKGLCHDSFYYQNILKKDYKYYIVDLDSIIIDLEISDLGKFIRRLMHKREYRWDFEKAKKLILSYSSVKPISKEELKVMLTLIIFPHKFWKLGKKRYVKNKNWNEKTYMRKLNRLIKNDEYQEKFLLDYLSFLETY